MAIGEGIERIPVQGLTNSEVSQFGTDLFWLIKQQDNQKMLTRRHLLGVLARHDNLEASIQSMERGRDMVRDGKLRASVLVGAGKVVGMETIVPDLPLRRPRFGLTGVLPAVATRKSDLLASNVEMLGPNVTAWIAEEHVSVDALASVYARLVERGGEGSWTIEPDSSDVASQAIQEAGLRLWGLPARYDDFEDRGVPPVSTLYAYMPNRAGESDR